MFWTDDRNQPRKINVKLAISTVTGLPFDQPYPGTYYTNEDQISVAKFYPSEVPKVFNEIVVTITSSILSEDDPVTGDVKNSCSEVDAKKLKAGMMLLEGAVDVSPALSPTYIVSVLVAGASSFFLTNNRVINPSTSNISAAFGFSECKNQAEAYLDYSIIGSVFRENTELCLAKAPLKQKTITSVGTTARFTQGWTGAQVPSGDYVAAGYDLYQSSVGFTNANVNLKFASGQVTEVTVTFGGSSGGDGFEVGSVLQFDYTQLPVPGGTGGGFIRWTLDSTDLACIQPPTDKTFYWSGSSIPYTKMKVDVPGILSDAPAGEVNTITDSNFIGDFGGDNYYEITTQYDHNITSSSTANAIAYATFSWPNPNFIEASGTGQQGGIFGGDSEFLKDKFVRFAYRFKFDDGEYSLISPFTQPAFIPKQRGFIQDGVFLVSTDSNEAGEATSNVPGTPFQRFATGEENIQTSTIVSFFENSIDTVELRIKMPYTLSSLKTKLKVVEIDIIYKESDAIDMKIADTIPEEIFKYKEDGVTLNLTNEFSYKYESREPFKLVQRKDEISRVSDKVPIRALSQETTGGRIIYGNFIDRHTSPDSLKYNVRAAQKSSPLTSTLPLSTSAAVANAGLVPSNSFLSYPTHTLKQNRTYQVGFVLSDRYGRQSDVILGPKDERQFYLGNIRYDGDTIFNPYFDNLSDSGDNNIALWRGQMLEVLLREAIPETITQEGYPGLYNSGEYIMDVATSQTSSTITFTSIDTRIKVGDIFTPISNNVVSTVTSIVISINLSANTIGFSSTVTVAPNTTTTAGEFINNTGIINGEPNVLGWYSYKMVVKQLTEDYYNAYLGNVAYLSPNSALSTVDGNYPFSGSSFVTSLLADNVNKIPADLIEVAPEQNQFGTSDALLYPRVGGTILRDSTTVDPSDYIYATNFVLGTQTASINAYGKIQDIGVAELAGTSPNFTGFKSPIQSRGVAGASSNPNAIIFSMPNGEQVGRQYWRDTGLYIYEVGALQSKLEIYWETSTCGLISDLNASFASGAAPSPSLPSNPTSPFPPTDGTPVQ